MRLLSVMLPLIAATAVSFATRADITTGVRVWLDIDCPGNEKADPEIPILPSRLGAGVSAGPVWNIMLAPGFYIEPGINLYYDTYRLHTRQYQIDDEVYVGASAIGNKVARFGIRIPVNAGWQFDISSRLAMQLSTGPEFEVGLVGTRRVTLHSDYDNLLLEKENIYDSDSTWQRFDIKWHIGMAMIIDTRWWIGIDSGFGLLNMRRSPFTQYDRLVRLGLGYNF